MFSIRTMDLTKAYTPERTDRWMRADLSTLHDCICNAKLDLWPLRDRSRVRLRTERILYGQT
jgi:hypothetical protein